eukprot:sb/3465613/
MSSSPCRKRQKRCPPASNLDVVDISDGENDDNDAKSPVPKPTSSQRVFNKIPIKSSPKPISVEDISDDEGGGNSSGTSAPQTNSGLKESPMKSLIRASLATPPVVIEVQTPDSSAGAGKQDEHMSGLLPKTIGSPRNMVQEISSTTSSSAAAGFVPFAMVQDFIGSTETGDKQFLLTGLSSLSILSLVLSLSLSLSLFLSPSLSLSISLSLSSLSFPYTSLTLYLSLYVCFSLPLSTLSLLSLSLSLSLTGIPVYKVQIVHRAFLYQLFKTNPTQPDESDPELTKLADAANRCRKKFANGTGPFHGHTVSIQSNHPRRQECYERLFKAGGGRVVGDYQKSLDYLTMVLVDDPDRTVIPNVLQNNTKVPLLRIKYIHELVLETV